LHYYELTVTTFLLTDINFDKANEKIAQAINQTMAQDEELLDKHMQNGYKYYVFNSFYPLEQDKVYKAGRVYVFKIRSLDQVFITKIKRLLPQTANTNFKVLATELTTQKLRYISELYTLTPVVITVDNKHWLPGNNFMLLQERLHANVEKKFKSFYGESIIPKTNFIQRIEVLNKKPIAYKYKNTKIFGNKFKVTVNEDPISQKLAFIAAACGLGEKGSALGMGFCYTY
jgi:CRISPR-associated endoribonuclease Cas6